MKNTVKLMFVAFMGGVVSLGGYKLFLEEKENTIIYKQENTALENAIIPTHYTSSNSLNTVEKTDLTVAADETLNAVVHVKNTSIKNVQDPYAQFFYGRSRGRKLEQVGTGSGVLISSDGYIITNNHVIDGANEIEITLNNKKTYPAEVIGTDASSDIALIKIEGADFDYVPFGNSDQVRVGEWVLAVGNPYNLTSTVTAGIVSAKGRDLQGNTGVESFIQTDAAVNQGNSGGALVNTRGELIGINTAITSMTGGFVGYSFAVPSNIAKKVIEDLMEFGGVQKALIGIQYNPNDDEREGVKVTAVTENGGAKAAGLEEGDVIVKINDVKIKQFSDLKGQLYAKRPGDVINVTILRNEETLIKSVKLTENKELKVNSLGFSIEKISAEEAEKLGVENGVRISNIQNSRLAAYGVKEGYILVEINNQKITSVSQVEEILGNPRAYNYIKLGILNLEGEKENYIFK